MIFITLLLACLAGHAMAFGEPSHKSFELRMSEKISAIKLAGRLKSPSFERLFHSTKLHAQSIGELLAAAADKNAQKAFLDDFSANQLLALNKCKLRDCALSELDRRDEICARLFRRKEQCEFVPHPNQRCLTSVGKSYANLYQYCRFVVDDCKEWCISEREALAEQALKKLKTSDRKRVKLFRDEVIAHADQHDTVNYKASVSSTLETKDDAKRARLRSSCKALVDILDNVHQIKSDNYTVDRHESSGWTIAYKLCQMVSVSAHKYDPAESGPLVCDRNGCH